MSAAGEGGPGDVIGDGDELDEETGRTDELGESDELGETGTELEDTDEDEDEDEDDTDTDDEDTDDEDTDDEDTDDEDDDTETDFETDEDEDASRTGEGAGAVRDAIANGDSSVLGAADAEYEAGDVNTISAPPRARVPSRSDRVAGDGASAGAASGTASLEVLEYLARAMADEPDAVVVRREQRRGSTVLRLHVAARDMGRIIGRRGRTAQAIRTLVGAASARDGVQTVVDIADD